MRPLVASTLPFRDPYSSPVMVVTRPPASATISAPAATSQGQWDTAVQLFQRGVDLAPDEPSLRHKLGTALAMRGDRDGAFRAFEETARRTPSFAKAHYSLGLMYAERGDLTRATSELTAAIKYQPNYVEAHLQLAELLRHTGRPEQALPHYRAVLDLDPRLAEALYGSAMALVQRGRYVMVATPDDPHFESMDECVVHLDSLMWVAADDVANDPALCFSPIAAVSEGILNPVSYRPDPQGPVPRPFLRE